MCGLGTWELLIVLAIVVLLFGATRLPQLGKALGDTVRNFKKGAEDPEEVEGQQSSRLASSKKKKKKSMEAHEVAQLVEGDEEEADRDG
jgi:sec-independent protein translocase protein TatA